MQFTVPQFIDVEDKIIGPITVRQFVMILVAGIFIFLEYKLSDMALFVVLAIPTIFVFGTFAFAKVNGMPFHYFILNVIQTFKKPNLRIWLRDNKIEIDSKKNVKKSSLPVTIPSKQSITRSRLSDLALVIDTGGVYLGEEKEKDSSFK